MQHKKVFFIQTVERGKLELVGEVGTRWGKLEQKRLRAYLKTYIKIKPSHQIYDRNILYGAMKFNFIKILLNYS